MRLYKFSLLTTLVLFCLAAQGQVANLPANWHLLDPRTDGWFGAGVERAYQDLLHDKKPQPLIVAVLDGGTDPHHEDLASVIWTNPREVINGADEDSNGYVDDIHGWNFIGGPEGNVHYDQFELTRLYKMLYARFGNQSSSTSSADFRQYEKIRSDFFEKRFALEREFTTYRQLLENMKVLRSLTPEENPTASDLWQMENLPDSLAGVVLFVASLVNDQMNFQQLFDALNEYVEYLSVSLQYHYNVDYDPRGIVGDDYLNAEERYYGNRDVAGPDASHGTHVAGIIAADRKNQLGVQGVAENVQLLIVRCVPDGDERDKDVANSIRYAVDQGARIINMSFGKSYSFNKAVVDAAVRYAMEKDVLIIHGAGNDNKNTDKHVVYPNKFFATGGTAANFINVGASTPTGQAADFSNYGRKTVDLFAPGEKIYSTYPANTYSYQQGTSMAAPVVTGVAAILRSYFPHLTSEQVRQILIRSAYRVDKKTVLPGSDRKVRWRRLCMAKGIVNAYNAVLLAERTSR